MGVLVCGQCGKVLSSCCDIYYEVVDEENNVKGVICQECAELLEYKEDN